MAGGRLVTGPVVHFALIELTPIKAQTPPLRKPNAWNVGARDRLRHRASIFRRPCVRSRPAQGRLYFRLYFRLFFHFHFRHGRRPVSDQTELSAPPRVPVTSQNRQDVMTAKDREAAESVFEKNKRREAEINDALRQEQARHEAVLKNMHRLRSLRLRRDAQKMPAKQRSH